MTAAIAGVEEGLREEGRTSDHIYNMHLHAIQGEDVRHRPVRVTAGRRRRGISRGLQVTQDRQVSFLQERWSHMPGQ